MYKIIILILLFSCSTELPENKNWKIIASNNTQTEFEYSVSPTDACSYLTHKGEDCCKEDGWIYCNYIKKANVIFYKDGKVKVSSITTDSSFPAADYWSNWHKEKGKLIFDNELFLNFPLEKHFDWE